MAVYTRVTDEALAEFLGHYDIGAPLSLKGIAEGVENSNFLLYTDQGAFILTLYEKRVAAEDLPFFLGLMDHLASAGVPCAVPIKRNDGSVHGTLCGRPAAVIEFLAGVSPSNPAPKHCASVGAALAKLHRSGKSFDKSRANDLGPQGWRRLFEKCRARADDLAPGLAADAQEALGEIESAWPRDLPSGIIHADLFPDNTLFTGERLTGLIDFYFACTDYFAYDLMITVNAWCFAADGTFKSAMAEQMIGFYTALRPLSKAERAALPILAKGAAMRFFLTRLYDWLNQDPNALVKVKDPMEYWRILRFYADHPDPADFGLDA